MTYKNYLNILGDRTSRKRKIITDDSLIKEVRRDLARKKAEQARRKARGEEIVEEETLDVETPSVIVNPEFARKDYLRVPGINGLYGGNLVISKFETQGFNNMNYDNTHKKLLSSGLYMPTPLIFMTHFQNVVKAHSRNGVLYDGLGNLISRKETEDIYQHLIRDHIAVYESSGGTQEGAWTWLNARFVSGTGFNNLDLEMVVGIDDKGELIIEKEPLNVCLWEDAYFDFNNINSQGLASEGSVLEDRTYEQAKNIYFLHPRNMGVAGFGAGSGRTYLNCGRNPDDGDASLGVFSCVEGAFAKESKDSRGKSK